MSGSTEEVPVRKGRWKMILACALVLIAIVLVWSKLAPGVTQPGAVADGDPDQWPVHGGTPLEQRFSPLDQINADNVQTLGLAWSATFDTNRGQEATPIMVDGVLYVSTAWSKVYAYDAATGRELWRFDPEVPGGKAVHACCDVVNRGVAVADGKVLVGTIDGRLIALDSRNGKPIWSAQTFDPELPYTITGAPRIVKDKVVIGNGGAELGVRGFVSAYRLDTGKLAWRFYTVPGDPAKGPDGAASDEALARIAKPTWFGRWWVNGGGGGTVWDSIVFDAELNQLYIGVGNGSVWDRKIRSAGEGDNLFVASIVALDPDTGKYRWHFQETPGDQWDYTSTQQITLADLAIDGRKRKALLHAPKNGFFYVVDRTTGRLISAKNFVPVNWATGIDRVTGRPQLARNARYTEGGFTAYPSSIGAHSWQPMAFSPLTGLVYIPVNHTNYTYAQDRAFRYRPGRWNMGVDLAPTAPAPSATSGQRPAGETGQFEGELLAWDPVAQKPRWSVRYPTIANGGLLATAGNLVFQGTVARTFQAFRASDGKRLWSAPTGAGVIAAPITYRIDGTQYVAIVAGAGGSTALVMPWRRETNTMPSGRLLVFKLAGKAALPADDSSELAPPNPSGETFSPAQVAAGGAHYMANCFVCHGGYVLPDLRRSGALPQAQVWRSIVIDGILESQGMASFKGYLSPADAEAIRAYVNGQAKELARTSAQRQTTRR